MEVQRNEGFLNGQIHLHVSLDRLEAPNWGCFKGIRDGAFAIRKLF